MGLINCWVNDGRACETRSSWQQAGSAGKTSGVKRCLNTDLDPYFTILNVSGNDENELALAGFNYSYLALQNYPFILYNEAFGLHRTSYRGHNDCTNTIIIVHLANLTAKHVSHESHPFCCHWHPVSRQSNHTQVKRIDDKIIHLNKSFWSI